MSGPAGNYFDKQGSRNPLYRALVSRFNACLLDLARQTGAREMLEVGCGEGHMSRLFASAGWRVRGADASRDIIRKARALTPEGAISYEAKAIEDLDPAADGAPLVAAIEVLEHVEAPDRALEHLRRLARPHVLLSVPREPLWRALNMARGKYLADGGNTPGHVNHWSAASFVRFVSTRFQVLAVRQPLPWTVVLARVPDDFLQ